MKIKPGPFIWNERKYYQSHCLYREPHRQRKSELGRICRNNLLILVASDSETANKTLFERNMKWFSSCGMLITSIGVGNYLNFKISTSFWLIFWAPCESQPMCVKFHTSALSHSHGKNWPRKNNILFVITVYRSAFPQWLIFHWLQKSDMVSMPL